MATKNKNKERKKMYFAKVNLYVCSFQIHFPIIVSTHYTYTQKYYVLSLNTPMATLGIFFRIFLKKHKLHNLIKREIHILTTTKIKKHANT